MTRPLLRRGSRADGHRQPSRRWCDGAVAPAVAGLIVAISLLIAMAPVDSARAQFLDPGGSPPRSMIFPDGDEAGPPQLGPEVVQVVGDLSGPVEIDLPGLGTMTIFPVPVVGSNAIGTPQDPLLPDPPPEVIPSRFVKQPGGAPPVQVGGNTHQTHTNGYYHDLCMDEPDDPICDDFWDYYTSIFGPFPGNELSWSMSTQFADGMFGPIDQAARPYPTSVVLPQTDANLPFLRYATHPYGDYVPLQDVPRDAGPAPKLGTDTPVDNPPATSILHGMNKFTPSVEEEYRRSLLNDAKTDTKTDVQTLGAKSDAPSMQTTGFTGRQELLEQAKTSVTNTAVEHGQVNPVARDTLLENAKTESAKTGVGEKTELRDTPVKSGVGDQHGTPRLEERTLSKTDEGIRNNRMPTLNEREQQAKPFGSERSPMLGGGSNGFAGHNMGPAPGGFGSGMHPSGGGLNKGSSTLRRE